MAWIAAAYLAVLLVMLGGVFWVAAVHLRPEPDWAEMQYITNACPSTWHSVYGESVNQFECKGCGARFIDRPLGADNVPLDTWVTEELCLGCWSRGIR